MLPDRIEIWKCWFLRRGENRSTRRKTSRSKGENQQQTQPTYGVDTRISNPGRINGRRVLSPLRGYCSARCMCSAILKVFSHLFGAKFTGRKFYRWHYDYWPIGQWAIFHADTDTAYVNHFFPREFIIWFKSIQAKQVEHETSSFARSLRNLMHWSSLRSLLRTYEMSTCSKSRSSRATFTGYGTNFRPAQTFDRPLC